MTNHFKTVKMSTLWFGVYLGLALCWTPRGRGVRVLLTHPHATCDLVGVQLTTLVRVSRVHSLRVTCLLGGQRSPLLESTKGVKFDQSLLEWKYGKTNRSHSHQRKRPRHRCGQRTAEYLMPQMCLLMCLSTWDVFNEFSLFVSWSCLWIAGVG